MATLERGKGARRHAIDISRHGATLRRHEIESGHERLPGYRRCADEGAAAAALAAEVQALLDDGMAPADEEAKAIAAARPPKKSGPATLPLRADLAIYNEATGFVVTSRKMAGKTLDEGSAAWKKAVAKGQLLPVALVQDDPFIVRVIAGEPLSAEEDRAWVSRVDAALAVPDGKLCVTGGAEFFIEDYDPDDASHERYVGELPVPKGTYHASLYACAHGVNGDRAAEDSGGDIVDFILHLDPPGARPALPPSPLPDSGWFSGEENARHAPDAPALAAKDVIRRSEEATGEWTFVRAVQELLPPLTRTPVRGDAVLVPLDALGHVARIVWLCSRFTILEARLTAPAGAALDLAGDWPEGVVAVNEGGTGRLLFDADLGLEEIQRGLNQSAARLAAQPEGTVLEVCSIAIEAMPGTPEGAGLLSWRGPIKGTEWRILQAYPEASAATLTAALAFAAAVDAGKRQLPDAINEFVEQFSSTWPSGKISLQPAADAADVDDDDEDDGLFPTKPITAGEVWQAPGGNVYHATMAMLITQKIGEEVARRERPLRGAGLKAVGDVVCSADDAVGYHGYIRSNGHAWAWFKLSAPANIEFQVATRFADGSVVVTIAGDGDNLPGVVAAHDGRVAEHAAAHGAPIAAEFNLQSLAETVEAVLRQS